MSADEFRSRMDDDVGAVLDRTDQVGRAEGIVDDDRQTVLMRKLRNHVDIRNIAVRVAESLEVDRLGVRSDRAFDFSEIMCIYECRADSELRECVGKEIVGSAVDGFLRNDVIAVLGKRLYGIGDRSRARCNSERRNTALKRRDALLKDILSRVSEASVDIACVREIEASLGMSRIVEDVGSCRVDRNCAGIGGRVRSLLTVFVK